MIGGHHPQMTYYVLFLWAAYVLFRLWEAWQKRTWKPFLVATAFLGVSAGVGALSQAANLLPYYEYGQYSIRGGSELERDQTRDPALQTGLDKSYAQSTPPLGLNSGPSSYLTSSAAPPKKTS
jgi:hypothetical protein